MCGGRERVAALLDKLEKNNVDLSQISKLPAFVNLTFKAKYTKNGNSKSIESENQGKNEGKDENKKVANKKVKNIEEKDEIESSAKSNSSRQKTLTWVVVFCSVIFGVIYHYQLHTHHGFTKMWLWWENVDLYAEQVCSLPVL